MTRTGIFLTIVGMLAGCASPAPVPPPRVEYRYPPSEWLQDCPVTARADRSNEALVSAYTANLEALAACNGDKRQLREWGKAR